MTAFQWPGGKRVAVLVSVLLESWSEGKSPTYFTRTTPLRAGAVDQAGMQWARYGGEEGIWRLLRLLDAAGVRATVFANGLSAERHPAAVRAIVRAGHDVAAHGYAQDQYFLEMARDQQQATIRKTLDILGDAAGTRPDGWCTPVYGWTEETYELLAREGVRWHADALDCSLPRRHETPGGRLIALPWSEFVDNRVLRTSPRDFFDVYRDSFDYLHALEPGGLLHIAVHSHFGGRPLVAAQFHKLLAHFTSFPDAWLPRHRELVDWFAAQDIAAAPYAGRFF